MKDYKLRIDPKDEEFLRLLEEIREARELATSIGIGRESAEEVIKKHFKARVEELSARKESTSKDPKSKRNKDE